MISKAFSKRMTSQNDEAYYLYLEGRYIRHRHSVMSIYCYLFSSHAKEKKACTTECI